MASIVKVTYRAFLREAMRLHARTVALAPQEHEIAQAHTRTHAHKASPGMLSLWRATAQDDPHIRTLPSWPSNADGQRPGELVLIPRVDISKYGNGGFVCADESAPKLQAMLFPGVDFAHVELGANARSSGAGAAGVHGERSGPAGRASAPSAVDMSAHTSFRGVDVLRVVRSEFRRAESAAPSSAGGRAVMAASPLDRGLAHLATLNRLRQSAPAHTVTHTRFKDAAVVVTVTAACVLPALPAQPPQADPHAPAPEPGPVPFVYQVRIQNIGTETVQLLGRHWVFTDSRGGSIHVPRNSPGVVGHLPTLAPGAAFEYVSGTQIATPNGSMEGSFQMTLAATNEPFDAKIGRTRLIGPPSPTSTPQRATEAVGAAM